MYTYTQVRFFASENARSRDVRQDVSIPDASDRTTNGTIARDILHQRLSNLVSNRGLKSKFNCLLYTACTVCVYRPYVEFH